MILIKNKNPASLIEINVLSDAFATAFLTAGIGYLTLENGAIDSSQVMRAVGLGISLGAIGSLLMGRIADYVGARKLLSIVQIVQISAYCMLWFSSSPNVFFTSMVSVFLLGRLASPLRGALPPRFIDKEKIIGFKTRLRTLTLLTILLGGAAVAVVTNMNWSMKSFVLTVGLSAYSICFLSTKMLASCLGIPIKQESNTRSGSLLSLKEWGMWAYLLFAFSIIAISSALIPFVLAEVGKQVAWLLFVSSVIGIAVNFAIQKVIRQKESPDRLPRNSLTLLIGVLLGFIGIVLLVNAFESSLEMLSFALIMVSVFIVTNCAQTLSTIVAWNVQYNAGDDKNRAYIIEVFSPGKCV